MALENVQFFGAADRKGKHADGKISSEYPAWYFDAQIEDLQEEIAHKKRMIDNQLVPPSELPYAREELKKQEEMFERIMSKPKLTGKDKDDAANFYKHLADQIGDSMPSRSEMKKGLADAHEEARRMTEPIINVRGKTDVLANMGINAKGGKISRNQAAKAFKIIGRVLGEPTNIEYLRKDYNHGTFHPERSLDEMV